jgi:hypothetical protein
MPKCFSSPQSTHSDNGHFLAYCHHDGKLSPGWLGWGVREHPPPFTISTITYKVKVYALAESAGTLPLFLLFPYMYSVFQPLYQYVKEIFKIVRSFLTLSKRRCYPLLLLIYCCRFGAFHFLYIILPYFCCSLLQWSTSFFCLQDSCTLS